MVLVPVGLLVSLDLHFALEPFPNPVRNRLRARRAHEGKSHITHCPRQARVERSGSGVCLTPGDAERPGRQGAVAKGPEK